MKPLKNYILVVQAEIETKTAGGLILTGSVETGSKPAVVKEVGPEVINVSIGDKLAVKWSDGLPVTVDGTQSMLISEDSVYAVY